MHITLNTLTNRKRLVTQPAQEDLNNNQPERIGQMAEEKVFHFYSRWHMGDNLLNLRLFYSLTEYLKANNMTILYYYCTDYPYNLLSEFNNYVDSSVVELRPLGERPESAIELWMGNTVDGQEYNVNFDNNISNIYRSAYRTMGIPGDANIWLDEPWLASRYDSLGDAYKDVDILIVNNVGNSHQFGNNIGLNDVCKVLSAQFKVVVTDPIDETVKCGRSDNLTLCDYAAIATHSKYIISVVTGPLCCFFNTTTKKHVKKWFFLFDSWFFSNWNMKASGIDHETIANRDYNRILHYFN